MTKIVSRRLIGSQADKNDDNDRNGAIPHTFGAYDHVTEVEYVPAPTSAGHDDNNQNGAIPHTFGAYNHVTEVEYVPDPKSASQDDNNKNGAIPHTFGAYDHVTEVEHLSGNDNNNKNGAIPHTFGAYNHVTEVEHLSGKDNNNKNGAIPHTFGAYKHVTEVDQLNSRGVHNVTDGGTLRLRGEDLPRGVLTRAQRESYNKDGYIILPGAFDDSQGTTLLEEVRNVIKRISTGGEGITRHDMSGSDGPKKRPSPIGRVLATFEPEDKSSPNPFERRIARLGLGVHQKLPAFRALTRSAFNRSVAESLGYSDPRITQSQLIAKLAGIGGQLVPHQDGAVSFSDPPSAMTFWYALEDSTVENGCLCVAKGSHLTTPLRQRLIKLEDGFPKFVDLEKPLWAQGAHEGGDARTGEYEYEALEVKKGTLILFHGNLMHRSEANKSEKSRMAYTFSVIDGRAECPEDSYVKPAGGDLESLS
ncbi:MAG: hypothetical protein L6R36_001025 [Xanthoria steineri]|nr:MAG: hypothetical protein L6R36_001025 [Xanthoria steineri]